MAVVANNLFVLPTATTFLVLLLSLLFLSPSPATGESNNVLDVSGKPLVAGSQYYIQPVSAPLGRLPLGRVSGRQTTFPICPNYVGLSSIFDQRGEPLPATFTPIGHNVTSILESSDITIRFPSLLFCRIGGMWELRLDPIARRSQVMAEGFNYNNDDKRQAFRIIPAQDSVGYMIASCPNSPPGNACSGQFHLLGVMMDPFGFGSGILGLSDSNPLVVVFSEADDEARSTTVGVATN